MNPQDCARLLDYFGRWGLYKTEVIPKHVDVNRIAADLPIFYDASNNIHEELANDK